MTKRKRYDGELQHLRNLEDNIESSGVGREIKAILKALNSGPRQDQESAIDRKAILGYMELSEALKDEVESLKEDNQAELEVSEALRGKLKKSEAERKELVIRAQKAERGLEGEETPDFPPIPMESAEDAETRRMNEELKMAEDRDCPPGGYEQGPDELRD